MAQLRPVIAREAGEGEQIACGFDRIDAKRTPGTRRDAGQYTTERATCFARIRSY
jgi:hypothetical protein